MPSRDAYTGGVRGGSCPRDDALTHIYSPAQGFTVHHESGALMIVRDSARQKRAGDLSSMEIAAAPAPAASNAALETVTVTSSKIGGDVQNIPIAITALSQEQLTATQTAGGPDLVKQVPNLTFTKTNFTGYSINNSRHFGTASDFGNDRPGRGRSLSNDIPFIRNDAFFEQEFYDVSRWLKFMVALPASHALWPQRDHARCAVRSPVSAKPSGPIHEAISCPRNLAITHQRRLEGMHHDCTHR